MNKICKIRNHSPYYEILKISDSSHHFPTHIHKNVCVGRIDSGERYLCLNNSVRLLKKGDLFCIPPFTAHQCYTKEGGKVSYTVFCFGGINDLTLEMLDADIVSSGCIINNIDELYQYALTNNTIEGLQNKYSEYLINYIDKYYDNSLTIEKLAGEVHLSKYHLLHMFKKNVGISLHQYLIQVRVKKAEELITNQNDLTVLALDTGFYDQSHFIRNFKKHVGMTPGNYYKAVKG